MGSSGMMLMVVLGIASIGLFMFGCDLGINMICQMRGQTSKKGGGAPGGGILGGLLGPKRGPPGPQGAVPGGGIDLTGLSPEEIAGIQQSVDPYPRVTLTEAIEFIANQATEDIDKGTYAELGRNLKLNIKASLLEHYKTWITTVAEYNDMRLKPLTGRALSKYSELLLDVTRRFNIRLNPAYEAALRANRFAGTPVMGNITANFAIARA